MNRVQYSLLSALDEARRSLGRESLLQRAKEVSRPVIREHLSILEMDELIIQKGGRSRITKKGRVHLAQMNAGNTS